MKWIWHITSGKTLKVRLWCTWCKCASSFLIGSWYVIGWSKRWEWHPFFHLFISIHAIKCLAPHFPWAHNQKEVITFYDVVCNMKKLEVFYLTPWDLHNFKNSICIFKRVRESIGAPIIWNYPKQHGKMVF